MEIMVMGKPALTISTNLESVRVNNDATSSGKKLTTSAETNPMTVVATIALRNKASTLSY